MLFFYWGAVYDLTGTHNYIYDELYRLIEATHPIPELPHENYVLDSLGNRITSHISNTHIVDKMNRLLEDEKYIYTYDNNGNQISKKDKTTGDIWQYSFNAENKLMQVTRPDESIVKFKYDGLGRRYEKEVIDIEGNTVSFRRYYYDGEDILFEADADNNLTRRYTHGPGIDEPLILEEDVDLDGTFDNAYYYLVDGLGSVKKLVDESGNIVKEYEYDTYGNIKKETGTLEQPYTYTGREWDKEISLYYYRARYYDSSMGRFISQDPIGFQSDVNFYRYVYGNPVNGVDAMGLSPLLHSLLARLTLAGINKLKNIKWDNTNTLYVYFHGGGFFERKKCEGYLDCVQRCLEKTNLGLAAVDFSSLKNISSHITSFSSNFMNFIRCPIGFAKNFFNSGGWAYKWANQYGSGIKFVEFSKLSFLSKSLAGISAGMTGAQIGTVIYCYTSCGFKNDN